MKYMPTTKGCEKKCHIRTHLVAYLCNYSLFLYKTLIFVGLVTAKALIGVSVCILLVLILLGVVVYYFRPWDTERRRNLSASPPAPPSPSTNRPRYRSTTELRIKEEDTYEMML